MRTGCRYLAGPAFVCWIGIRGRPLLGLFARLASHSAYTARRLQRPGVPLHEPSARSALDNH